ncbi:MAG: Asp-tRNA(Asn)/Glu-tRNA(Gln) amidotransferase subunit GatC [Anaerolineaceae bacterium]|jgi:aspartyl-tRNA(Asn)/glutamyl-tRNA(Gln) amidotransferase subunit C|nr:Asp-tRNA(Asn)/Glu-tRNA(Gln) amidotransferase subunit GatC [Anaerolineaceae bacterium]
MSLSPNEVEHIAKLARLTLTDEEKALYGEQLSAILAHFAALEKVDTDHVSPLSSVLAVQTGLRVDKAHQELDTEALLANAPQVEDDQFRVPPVQGGGA